MLVYGGTQPEERTDDIGRRYYAAIAKGFGFRYNPESNAWTRFSGPAVRAARYNHTAVWTGSEMINWGGGRESVDLGGWARFDDGIAYNQSTGIWREINNEGTASPRMQHTAVWTGSEMVVVGGRIGYTWERVTGGGRYNPERDEWAPLPPIEEGRILHTFVWSGSEAIVWGGYTAREEFSPLSAIHNSGMGYNLTADDWRSINITYAPSARTGHTAVWTGSEMIIWGGNGATGPGSFGPLGDGGRYVP